MSRKLLVIDFGSNPKLLPGADKFFQTLTDCRVVPIPASRFSSDFSIRSAVNEGNEIVGFAGDCTSNISLAAQVVKAGGVVFAFGDGALTSWCKSNAADSPDRNSWLNLFNLGEATKLHSFQQRIGGN